MQKAFCFCFSREISKRFFLVSNGYSFFCWILDKTAKTDFGSTGPFYLSLRHMIQ